ncbi:MAG: GNAT family N-acetyltransferase, partial [Actinomycetia bacterium]|nr:GNAT family N-acetyltransferase [Actinomycetes bacterium]
ERIVGFCWTRIHDNGDGEIYRIGVVPYRSGSGAGRALLSAGLAYLVGHDRVQRYVLWVDASNERAISLYRSVGMQTERTIREFEQR